jgi:uncharacterized protein YfaS (alpha-2-macroglobulin family)
VYALHVLIEANDRGMTVPADLLQNGRPFLQRMARRDANNIEEERTSAYALYLLARQGVVVANEAAALQKRLRERYAKTWATDIAAAWLASAYQLMTQQTLADDAINAVTFGNTGAYDRWNGTMARDGTLLYLLSRHFPQRLPRLSPTVLEDMVRRVQTQDYNSLSAAVTVLALDAYATASATNGEQKLGIEAVLPNGGRQTLTLPPGLFPKVNFPQEARFLTLNSAGDLRAFYLVNESGFDRAPPTTAITQSMEIMREFLGADGKPISSVKRGDEVQVRIRFRAIGRQRIDDAVLVDLLPGGFDLVLPQGASSRDDDEDEGGCPCQWLNSRPSGFPDFADLREDRVVVYGRATSALQEFTYTIKATNVGNYVVPAAFGLSMYEPLVRARSVAGRIRIEPLQ